jgi:hypothetical protein
MPIGFPYNPDQCCFLLSQSLNANQFDPNVPDTGVLTPHNLLWNFVENKLQWVETLIGGIIVQELGGGGGAAPVDNKKIVLVDGTFGNDATAVLYDMFLPYQTVDAAILAAGDGDLIMVNPNTSPYTVTENLFGPGISFYIWKGATLNVMNAARTSGVSDITILGDGNINFFTVPTLSGTYSGNFKLECGVLNLKPFLPFIIADSFSGDIEINADKIILEQGSLFFHFTGGYWPTATKPTNFILNANFVVVTDVFLFYSDSVQINIDIKNYRRSTNFSVGNGKDFYKVAIAAPTYNVVNRINMDDAVIDKSINYSDSVFFFLIGTTFSKTFITGTYKFIGSGGAVQVPGLIEVSCTESVFFDGVAYIVNGAMVIDLDSIGSSIKTETLTRGGAAYNGGGSATFFNVPAVTLTGGGAGAVYDVTVTLGVVTGLVLVTPGTGYAVGDTFEFNNVDLGGTGAGVVITVDSLNTAKVVIGGKVYQDNSRVAFNEYLFSTYFIAQASLQVKADTISNNPNNNIVRQGSYVNGASGGQVSITNCQLVNTDPFGAAPAVIGKGFSAFVGPQSWGTLRVLDTKIITTGANSIEGGAVAEPAEIVTVYSNTPTLSIANTVPAMPGEFVDAGLTSDDF